MKDPHAAEWEELARREPYFAVLTSDGLPDVEGNRVATAAFLETGEEDVAALLAAIASLVGRAPAMGSALDFGCGAGRLTIPLARRAGSVVACDIAPTMLTHAGRNVERAGLHNVTFLAREALDELPAGRFDLVCSLLVFQYIPPALGHATLQTLVRLLAPDGLAALHLTFALPGRRLSRFARWSRERGGESRERESSASVRKPLSYTDVNEYDERAVRRCVETAGARIIGRFDTKTGDVDGAVLVVEKG